MVADIFANMNIPWTPRLILRTEPQSPASQTPEAATPDFCLRTIHAVRAVVDHAVTPYPDIAKAISTAFLAFIRGQLTVDFLGDPVHWTASQHLA